MSPRARQAKGKARINAYEALVAESAEREKRAGPAQITIPVGQRLGDIVVEADHVALECARKNVDDERARFHWADATSWLPNQKLNAVVMNPPFHSGRRAEPGLGIQFIQTAARSLLPSGQLWMVANRHLPYESTLQACFARVDEIAGDNRFKVFHAQRPMRKAR